MTESVEEVDLMVLGAGGGGWDRSLQAIERDLDHPAPVTP